MPSTKGKLAKNSTFLGCPGKLLTICHPDPGPDKEKEAKQQENNYSLEAAADTLDLEIELEILDSFCSLFRKSLQ